MRRFRVLSISFDSRATLLTQEIRPDWEPQVRALHHENRAKVMEGLLAQYGGASAEQKLQNFIELSQLPMSVIAFHNQFHSQARDAFVVGAYYPALTGICALGERVLNHLLIGLRDAFKARPEYKTLYRKSAFDDWNLAVSVLRDWGVLLGDAEAAFRKLENLRHRSIHFRPEVDKNDREMALEGIRLFTSIVTAQFNAFGRQPWFIPGSKGAAFIKKDWESDPFIRLVYIPSCARVSPYHTLEIVGDHWQVIEPVPFPEIEVSDEEFLRRLEAGPPVELESGVV